MKKLPAILIILCVALGNWGDLPLAAPFRYSAENTALKDFLCAYATHENLSCATSEGVQGNISGEFNFASREEFLAFMGRSKQITAYTDAASMNFCTRTELVSDVIPLGQVSVGQLTEALKQLRAYDGHFPLRGAGGGTLAHVTAPPVYVKLIRSVASSLTSMAPPPQRATRIFHLKHAWADDVEVTLGQSSKTVPGVASLLRKLVGTQDIENANSSSRLNTVNRRMGQGLARQTGTRDPQFAERTLPPDGMGSGLAQAASPTGQTGARILADARMNAVVIWDDATLMPFYEAVIKELDRPLPLVEIRAAIADVNVADTRQLGLSFSYQTGPAGGGKVGVAGGINNTAATPPVDYASTVGYGLNATTIFTNGIDTLLARIQALESKGNATVLSRPAVLTLDNVEAVLENTNTFYVQLQGYQTVDLFDVTYGTVLRVTPHIVEKPGGARMIKLVVNVEDGVANAPGASSGLSLPEVGKTTINTQAMVGDGQALVIGGYYYETKQISVNGVPYLMHIALLGYLFKTEEDVINKKERLFVISPRIIDPANLPPMPSSVGAAFERTLHPMTEPARQGGGCARSRYVQDMPAQNSGKRPAGAAAPNAAPVSNAVRSSGGAQAPVGSTGGVR